MTTAVHNNGHVAVALRRDLALAANEVALVLPADLSQKDWEDVGARLGGVARASCWWIGDWIIYGQEAGYVSRERYDRAVEITGLKRQTLRQYAHTCRQWPIVDRNLRLSFRAHRNSRAPLSLPELKTERQRQVARRARERVERAVGSCNALGRSVDHLKIEHAAAMASPDEIAGWDESFKEAIRALRELRVRIKEVSKLERTAS